MKKYSLEKYVGVRYTKHKTRKYKGRVDQCFFIRYRLDGKVKEECAGWSHQGVNAAIASEIRAELKSNQRTGEGERTLADKRLKVKEKEDKIRAELEKQNADNVSFNKVFFKSYFPHAQLNKKDSSFNREKSLFVKWIDPVIGKMPLKDIAVFHIEKIKKNMNDSGQSPRSIQYAFAVIRQVYNWSYKEKLFDGDNPVLEVKLSKFSNKRNEFLSIEQADELLTALKEASQEVWEQALISLHCGLRASEIFSLRWADINNINGMITILDTKNSIDRKAHMTSEVKEMFKNKKHGRKNELVYTDSVKGKKKEISKIFRRVVEELGFNKDIDDRRQRICFHSLRHTYASWLVQEGEHLYVVQKLLGHSTAALTERYSHLAPENTKKSAKTIENKLKKTTAKVIPIQK